MLGARHRRNVRRNPDPARILHQGIQRVEVRVIAPVLTGRVREGPAPDNEADIARTQRVLSIYPRVQKLAPVGGETRYRRDVMVGEIRPGQQAVRAGDNLLVQRVG